MSFSGRKKSGSTITQETTISPLNIFPSVVYNSTIPLSESVVDGRDEDDDNIEDERQQHVAIKNKSNMMMMHIVDQGGNALSSINAADYLNRTVTNKEKCNNNDNVNGDSCLKSLEEMQRHQEQQAFPILIQSIKDDNSDFHQRNLLENFDPSKKAEIFSKQYEEIMKNFDNANNMTQKKRQKIVQQQPKSLQPPRKRSNFRDTRRNLL